MEFTKKVQMLLDEKGWTKADLARAGPFNWVTVHHWLKKQNNRPKASEPRYRHLKRLAEISGKDIAWWLS